MNAFDLQDAIQSFDWLGTILEVVDLSYGGREWKIVVWLDRTSRKRIFYSPVVGGRTIARSYTSYDAALVGILAHVHQRNTQADVFALRLLGIEDLADVVVVEEERNDQWPPAP